MSLITLFLSFLFVCLALYLRRGQALGLLILSAVIWPEYLRISLGVIQMSVPRFVACALLLSEMTKSNSGRFKWQTLDVLVLLFFLWNVVSALLAGASFSFVSSSVGTFLDTCLIYFVARLCIEREADLRDLYPFVLFGGVFMGGVGTIEALTGWSPYQSLLKYHTWLWVFKEPEYRLGMLRAQASTGHYIFFGLAMFCLCALLHGLRNWRGGLHKIGITVAAAGVLSSLSSGPISALFLFCLLYCYSFFPKLIRPSIIGVVILLVAVELLSNRHFYHLIEYASLKSGNGWYRARLIEVAVSQLHEYWAFGFGGELPHHWGKLIDGRGHVDLVNQYVLVAAQGGVLAFFLYISILFIALKNFSFSWRNGEKKISDFSFTGAVMLLAFSISIFSVGVFGPAKLYLFIFLGVSASLKTLSVSKIRLS